MLDILKAMGLLLVAVTPLVLIGVTLWKRPSIGYKALAIYIMSYLPFSLAGEYVIANHGGQDWRREWCPKQLVIEYQSPSGRPKMRWTLLCAPFLPLVVLDQLFWHRSSHPDWAESCDGLPKPAERSA